MPIRDIFSEYFNSIFLAQSVLIEVEAKCFRLKSDLQTLPRVAEQLTFEGKSLMQWEGVSKKPGTEPSCDLGGCLGKGWGEELCMDRDAVDLGGM